MDQKHFIPAHLDENELHKLQVLEETLHESTGQDVIIVAYQVDNQQNMNQS